MKRLLLNTLITILVCALLAVTVLYAITASGLFTASEEEYMHTDSGDAEIATAFRFLMPEFIGARGSAIGSVGFLAGDEATEEIYSFLSPAICAAFADGTGTPVAGGLWSELIRENNVIYLRYHSRYTAAMIAAHLGSTSSIKGENPTVSEILMVLDGEDPDSGKYVLYTRNTNGDLCVFATEGGYRAGGKAVLIDTETFSRYSELSGNSPFNFVALSNISGIPAASLLSPSQPVLDTPPAPAGLNFEATEGELSSELLAFLGFPPAGLGNYVDDLTGARVYVNTLGTLRHSASNIEFEATSEGGISLLGTNDNVDAYSVFESIYAVEALLSRLNEQRPDLFGNDARLILTETTAENGAVTLKYGYFYSNVMILDANGERCGITVTVKNGKILHINADLLNARAISYRIKSYPMFTVLRVLTPSVSPKVYSALRLAYRVADGDVYTEWMLETE